MASIGDIITARVRVKLLELFFSNPSEKYHVRGLERAIGEEINSVRRELGQLERAGILQKEQRKNRLLYWPRKEYPLFGDLISIVAKSTGIGGSIVSNKSKLGSLSFVMFSGRFVRWKERVSDEEVEILVVGKVGLNELSSIIRAEESRRGREINYTVMTREEFDFRKKRRDPFLQGILAESRVMIIGDEDLLVS